MVCAFSQNSAVLHKPVLGGLQTEAFPNKISKQEGEESYSVFVFDIPKCP